MDIHSPLGLVNVSANCWGNATFQCIANLPAYKEAAENLPNEEVSSVVETDLKVNALVVGSYLLLGIGLALAFSSVYLALLFNPVVAFSSPTLPIALGALGIQQGTPTSAQNKVGNRPLIDAISAYHNEQRLSPEGTVSKVDSQELRKWAYANKLVDSSSESSHQDPAPFLGRFLENSGHTLPLMTSTRTYYDENGLIVHQTEPTTENTPASMMTLQIPDQTANYHNFDQLLHAGFAFESGENRGVAPTAVRSSISKTFVTTPDDITGQINLTAWNEQGKVKISVPVRGLAHFVGRADVFGNKTHYKTDGFIVHEGGGIDGGHYVSYVLVGDQWWKMNDDKGTRITRQEAEKQMENTYIFHAVKEDVSWGKSFKGMLSGILGSKVAW